MSSTQSRVPRFSRAHRLGQFEVRASHRRQAHVLGVGIVLHGLDTLDAVLLRLVQIVEQGSHGVRHEGVFLIAQRLPPVRAD